MKLKNITLVLAATSLFALPACKKDSKQNDGGGKEINITDVKSLNDHLNIEGAERKTGHIPAPSGTNYGSALTVTTPVVVLTPGNIFDLEFESPGTAKVVFIQLEGVDEYFQIVFDADGEVVSKTTGNRQRIRQCCNPNGCGQELVGKPMMSNLDVPATVQTYTPPLQGSVPDMSFLNDIQYWAPPISIRYKTYGTGVGDIFTTLTWNREGDIDLWLIEPDGNKIYYANPYSETGGELDYDNTVAYGPENIFYDETTPPSGKYEVWVHYYSGDGNPVDWTVTLKNGSSQQTHRGTLNNVDDKKMVTSFTY